MQVYLGEAAVNQGAFHESLNMAALWKLPLLVIVENNRFGMGTAWERASSLYDISQKASAYAMPAAIADGMDVLDMYRVTKEAVARARAGEGPTLIEARTYRFVGHSMSDPVSGVYRTNEDVEREKQKDPIRIFADLLARENILSQEELEKMDEEVKRVSAWAAILFAPTLVGTIYGMNFTHMPELDWVWGYPFAILLMGVVCGGLYLVFKRRGWL